MGMTALLRGISARATAPPYPFLTYTPENMTTNVMDPLAPPVVLQDPMMLAMSPRVIAYVADTFSPQVSQQEKENDEIHMVIKPYLA